MVVIFVVENLGFAEHKQTRNRTFAFHTHRGIIVHKKEWRGKDVSFLRRVDYD